MLAYRQRCAAAIRATNAGHVHLEALLALSFAHDLRKDDRLGANEVLRPFTIDEVEGISLETVLQQTPFNRAAKLSRPLHGCLIVHPELCLHAEVPTEP